MRELTRALALCLGLAACASAPPPAPEGAFRAAGAPIWSNAQLDQTRLTGRWDQVAGFGAGDCRPGGAEVSGRPGALAVAARLCLGGREARISGPLEVVGPGRFRVAGQEWWVIWADYDYRTLAIGTPSGQFGFVLNRGRSLPQDRLRAAAEIFDFNGYDAGQLVRY
ncbi:MAG: lipocalin family protein [Cypionkella sp.]|jgi:apolipoprotein D and lipocalin family protein|nr:lipocalin family protein [Cypionkella sp.]